MNTFCSLTRQKLLSWVISTIIIVEQDEALKTGMEEKKIVITTRRCLFFESLSNVVAEIEYEVMKSKKNKNKPGKEKAP